MFKKLLNWVFATEDLNFTICIDQPLQPITHDFSVRKAGHDLSFRLFDGGVDAQGVAISETPIVTGDILVTPKLGYTEDEDEISTFIVLKSEEVAPQVFNLDLTIYEEDNADI